MAAEFSGGHPRIYRRMIKRPNQSLIHIIRKKPECSRKDAKPTDVFPIGGGIPFEGNMLYSRMLLRRRATIFPVPTTTPRRHFSDSPITVASRQT
jgi:hypothetical protein